MPGVKPLTCLLFVVLLSVTVRTHSTLHRHMKRNNLEACTKDMASLTFNASPSLSNTTAAICYKAGCKYKVEDESETYFRSGLIRTCYVGGWSGPNTIDYTCFYLLGKNKFTANDDGGYENLAIEHADKCNWNSDTKELSCTD
ncbi:uncharacterized protein UDID_19660 [Ustilago sp. UG-2017a]|nr:uncharacterized protein UDID_19660 [Ustilago sp. UG-2017a]